MPSGSSEWCPGLGQQEQACSDDSACSFSAACSNHIVCGSHHRSPPPGSVAVQRVMRQQCELGFLPTLHFAVLPWRVEVASLSSWCQEGAESCTIVKTSMWPMMREHLKMAVHWLCESKRKDI